MLSWLNRRTIWQQLVFLVLLLVIPTIGFFSWFLATDLQSEKSEAHAKVSLLINYVANTIARDQEQNKTLLQLMANLPKIKAMDSTDCPSSLSALGKLQIEYVHLALVNAQGQVVCSFLPTAPSIELIQKEYAFRSLLAPKQSVDDAFVNTNAIFDKEHDTWLTIFSYPVYHQQHSTGAPDGVLILTLDLVKLSQNVFRDAPSTALIAVLYDKQTVIMRSHSAKAMIGQLAVGQLRDELVQRERGSVNVKSVEGVPQIGAFQPIPDTNWTIVAGLPESVVLAEHARVVNACLYVAMPGLFLTFLLTWYVSRSIVKPIAKLAQTASEIAHGDTRIRAECNGSMEIIAVATQLNAILDLHDKSEASLRASDSLNRAILHSIKAEIVGLDRHGEILMFNLAYQNALQQPNPCCTDDPMRKRYLHKIFNHSNPLDDNIVHIIDEGISAVLNGTAVTFCYEYQSQFSEQKSWFSLVVTALDQTQGGVVIARTDISERMRADLALRENQDLLNNIINSSSSYIFALDRRHRTTLVNDAMVVFMGLSKQQLMDKTANELFPPEIAAEINAVNEHIFQTGEVFYSEEMVVGKDGNLCQVMTSKFPLRDEKGNITGLAGVASDLTEFNATRNALQARETQNQALISAIPDMIFINRRDGMCLSCHVGSDAAMRPISAERFLHKTIEEIYPPAVAEIFMQGMQKAITRDSLQEVNFELSTDGDIHHYEARIVRFDQDKALSIVRDVTLNKQVDMALRSSLREKLGLLNEVHHRVKNNLQIVASLLRLEAARSTNEETIFTLTDMQNRIRVMALLHEALYRNGAYISINLDDYLHQLAPQILSASIAFKHIIQLQLDLATVRVSMDQATPCGLLVNELLTNALTHAFPNGRSGTIKIELRMVPDSQQVCLSIIDDGIGLPAEFSTLNHSLGLQLVTDLVQQLKGRLEADSENGTALRIFFTPDIVRAEKNR